MPEAINQFRFMKRNFIGLLLFSILFISTHQALAQFEGTFNIDTYHYADNGQAIPQKTLHVFMTPERILVRGLKGTQMPSQLGGVSSDAILVRLDKKDFIIFSDNNQALQIQKSEVENLVNMSNSLSSAFGSSSSAKVPKPKTVLTHVTKKIDGYNCQKIEITDTDKAGHMNQTDVWVTREIPVRWGMLAESWNISDSDLASLISPSWLKDGAMPLSMQVYQDGNPKYSMKVTNLKKMNVPSSQTSIPAGYQLVSIRQLLMNSMFGN